MFPAHVFAVLCQFWLAQSSPVAVSLYSSVDEIRPGEPILFKASAVNRLNTALRFSPPLSTWRYNLRYECKPPNESRYFRITMPALGAPASGHSPRWDVDARHVSYDYIFGHKYQAKVSINKEEGKTKLIVFASPGSWEIRAVVIAEGKPYYSVPVRVKVRCNTTDTEDDALKACYERLIFRMSLPTTRLDAKDFALFTKHVSAFNTSQVNIPMRRILLLYDIVHAGDLDERTESLSRLGAFQKKCTPLEQEYAELLLGVAYVQAKDFRSAQSVLKNSKDEWSMLKSHIVRELKEKE